MTTTETTGKISVVEQSVKLYDPKPADKVYESIAEAGHKAHRAGSGETVEFIFKLIKWGHESVLEHESFGVDIVTNRAMLAELTRHRLASYTVESTRYVTYSGPVEVIKPYGLKGDQEIAWVDFCVKSKETYNALLASGLKAEIARDVLPLCLATNLRMTANFREWRHIFRLRTSPYAHPQMRELVGVIFALVARKYPVLFCDIPTLGLDLFLELDS
jgi:thymidylate synthase (FAD)